jgi:hypothetical protein
MSWPGGAHSLEDMQSLLLAMTLAAGVQVPAAVTTTTPVCELKYQSAYAGYSTCQGGTGFQHRAYGICYGISEYTVIGTWADPTERSWVRCDRFHTLVGDFEIR